MPVVHETQDVVVMGAGAAGALFAARLAEAGKSVVVLEAGPAWQLSDLVSSQIWARRLKWGGPPVETAGEDRIGHNLNVGQGLGGSAIHHYASWPRLHYEDFHTRSLYGLGRDWPFGYETLRPWYDRVQDEVGLSGDAAAEVWRPPAAAYPMPPLKQFAQARIVGAGFAKLGMRVAPMPMAVTSVEYKDRPPCLYDGWCDAGCPIGALINPLVLHIPQAKAKGAEFRTGVTVTAIERDARGKPTALRYVADDGAIHIQSATTIVLAGAAIQNARLLLAQGIGNRSGLVGRGFTPHVFGNSYGLFAQETECHRGLTAGSMTCQDDYGKVGHDRPYGSIAWGFASAIKPNDIIGIMMTRPDLYGPALDTFLHRASRHIAFVTAVNETIQTDTNRIELTAARDKHGVPNVRVTHTLAPESARLTEYARDKGLAIMRAAGATEVWATPGPRNLGHLAGGTAMGEHADSSVTDSYGRLHEHANLVIAGGGLFPSIGAVSPTFTVLALASRTAARMIEHGADFA